MCHVQFPFFLSDYLASDGPICSKFLLPTLCCYLEESKYFTFRTISLKTAATATETDMTVNQSKNNLAINSKRESTEAIKKKKNRYNCKFFFFRVISTVKEKKTDCLCERNTETVSVSFSLLSKQIAGIAVY